MIVVQFRIIIGALRSLNELEDAFPNQTILHRPFGVDDGPRRWKWSGEFTANVNEDGLISVEHLLSAIDQVTAVIPNETAILRRGLALDLQEGELVACNLDSKALSFIAERDFEFGFEIFATR